MRVLVLGGAGLQGRVAVYDLLRTPAVSEVVCLDQTLTGLDDLTGLVPTDRLRGIQTGIDDPGQLAALMGGGFDVVVDLLPSRYLEIVAAAAIKARCNLVNTMYAHQLPSGVDAAARDAGITIMPEAGLDPGIDLVLCALGVSRLDSVDQLHSYCGGIPERRVADANPLRYKISWSWEGALKSYARPARFMRGGKIVNVTAADQHNPRYVTQVDFPGIGELEVIPNGDAITFAELLGVLPGMRETSRCTYRWPGHSALWYNLAQLGFLDDQPVPGLGGGISPRDFLVHHLGPRLQYGPGERDLVVMRVVVGGMRDGHRVRLTYDLVDERDLGTGFLAMTRTVGFSASIVAQMVASGAISAHGVLTAVKHIPPERFVTGLQERGVVITARETREPGPATRM
jgi:saccharopine dehydrogenase-like NADP-dependent oxidoreductase